ncbi:hypothetical protein CASFOL_011835 [Castilleja foliolosa]|uniref:Uncharacterized protein n=1 Tax=Castilleja foliolosa TaxID=1961234 RepID=A0ABD3DDR5_9LAMI
MGRSCLCRVLVLTFLMIFLTDGFGRELVEKAVHASDQGSKSRDVIEMDYEDAGPNVNGRSSLIDPPPPPGLGF